MEVRIFKPTKTAMQSGRGNIKSWVMEFETTSASTPDKLMGWSGSSDTMRQVTMAFETKDAAISYAKKNGYCYSVHMEKTRCIKPKAYADNFLTDRIAPWTH